MTTSRRISAFRRVEVDLDEPVFGRHDADHYRLVLRHDVDRVDWYLRGVDDSGGVIGQSRGAWYEGWERALTALLLVTGHCAEDYRAVLLGTAELLNYGLLRIITGYWSLCRVLLRPTAELRLLRLSDCSRATLARERDGVALLRGERGQRGGGLRGTHSVQVASARAPPQRGAEVSC